MMTAMFNPAAWMRSRPATSSSSISLHCVQPKWRVNESSSGFSAHRLESCTGWPDVFNSVRSGALR